MGMFSSELWSEPELDAKLGSGLASGPEWNQWSGSGFGKSTLLVECIQMLFKPKPLVLEAKRILQIIPKGLWCLLLVVV
jgi:hypothetical protein